MGQIACLEMANHSVVIIVLKDCCRDQRSSAEIIKLLERALEALSRSLLNWS